MKKFEGFDLQELQIIELALNLYTLMCDSILESETDKNTTTLVSFLKDVALQLIVEVKKQKTLKGGINESNNLRT